MKFEDIKVPIAFKQSTPSEIKLNNEREYFKKHKTISRPLLITSSGFIIDGFVKYLILKENGYKGELSEDMYIIGEDINNVISPKENFEANLNNNVSYSASSLTKNIRKQIYENDGGYCYLCGEKIDIDNMAIDHVVPKSGGGENNTNNARCCCFVCNQMKGSMSLDEFVSKIKKIYTFRNL